MLSESMAFRPIGPQLMTYLTDEITTTIDQEFSTFWAGDLRKYFGHVSRLPQQLQKLLDFNSEDEDHRRRHDFKHLLTRTTVKINKVVGLG